MARKVRWGVLSTAGIGREKVIPAMLAGGLTEVAAIASRDPARAGTVAQALGIPRAYGSYEELLADPAVEAVYNPLPNHLHRPWTIRALEAGKHVLCEKPVGLNAGEAEEISQAASRAGRLVAEAFMVRHHPQWRRAREIARSGRLGEVRAMQAVFAYHLTDPENVRNQLAIGGGGLYDVGCYAVAAARFVFGAEPERVAAAFDRDPSSGIDRLTSGLAVFPGGRQLIFTCATQLAATQDVQICGTRSRLRIHVPFNPDPRRPTQMTVDDGADLTGAGAEVETFPPVDQYTLQADAFSRAVIDGAPLEFPIADAIANMRVVDALFRSAETGAWERP